jgi:tryptophan synthase alpha chain
MNQVAAKFAELQHSQKKALIPYIMGGDPELGVTPKLVEVLIDCGVDLIEVGAPFSDPLADGPVIQSAGLRALRNGCTLSKLLHTLQPVAISAPIPLVLMIYYNMIYQYGLTRFFDALKTAGLSGLIIPDLPPDEAEMLQGLAQEYQIGLNFLVAPTSNEARIRQAAEASTGFVYAVSVKGITGVREQLPPELPQFITKVVKITAKPVAVGFGIASPEQAASIAKLASGVIVGSAIVRSVASDTTFRAVRQLVRELRAAVG